MSHLTNEAARRNAIIGSLMFPKFLDGRSRFEFAGPTVEPRWDACEQAPVRVGNMIITTDGEGEVQFLPCISPKFEVLGSNTIDLAVLCQPFQESALTTVVRETFPSGAIVSLRVGKLIQDATRDSVYELWLEAVDSGGADSPEARQLESTCTELESDELYDDACRAVTDNLLNYFSTLAHLALSEKKSAMRLTEHPSSGGARWSRNIAQGMMERFSAAVHEISPLLVAIHEDIVEGLERGLFEIDEHWGSVTVAEGRALVLVPRIVVKEGAAEQSPV